MSKTQPTFYSACRRGEETFVAVAKLSREFHPWFNPSSPRRRLFFAPAKLGSLKFFYFQPKFRATFNMTFNQTIITKTNSIKGKRGNNNNVPQAGRYNSSPLKRISSPKFMQITLGNDSACLVPLPKWLLPLYDSSKGLSLAEHSCSEAP